MQYCVFLSEIGSKEACVWGQCEQKGQREGKARQWVKFTPTPTPTLCIHHCSSSSSQALTLLPLLHSQGWQCNRDNHHTRRSGTYVVCHVVCAATNMVCVSVRARVYVCTCVKPFQVLLDLSSLADLLLEESPKWSLLKDVLEEITAAVQKLSAGN